MIWVRHFGLSRNKPPLFGGSRMGEVARQSRVGGGFLPPQSANADSSPHPFRDRGALKMLFRIIESRTQRCGFAYLLRNSFASVRIRLESANSVSSRAWGQGARVMAASSLSWATGS